MTKIDRWRRQSRIAWGLASYANTPGNTNAIGPHGITVLGADRVVVTNGGPTEPKDASGAPIPRKALAAQNPVADLFGRHLGVRARREPGCGGRQSGDRLQPRRRSLRPRAGSPGGGQVLRIRIRKR